MEKQITPQIVEILRRDANDNLTEGQRNYLLSEQGWTLEDYEKRERIHNRYDVLGYIKDGR